MRKLITLSLISLLAVSANASEFEQKRDRLLADKTISEPVRKELKEHFDKSDVIYKECKTKREELRSKLSPEAKDAMKKHFKRKKEEKMDQKADQQTATQQNTATSAKK